MEAGHPYQRRPGDPHLDERRFLKNDMFFSRTKLMFDLRHQFDRKASSRGFKSQVLNESLARPPKRSFQEFIADQKLIGSQDRLPPNQIYQELERIMIKPIKSSVVQNPVEYQKSVITGVNSIGCSQIDSSRPPGPETASKITQLSNPATLEVIEQHDSPKVCSPASIAKNSCTIIEEADARDLPRVLQSNSGMSFKGHAVIPNKFVEPALKGKPKNRTSLQSLMSTSDASFCELYSEMPEGLSKGQARAALRHQFEELVTEPVETSHIEYQSRTRYQRYLYQTELFFKHVHLQNAILDEQEAVKEALSRAPFRLDGRLLNQVRYWYEERLKHSELDQRQINLEVSDQEITKQVIVLQTNHWLPANFYSLLDQYFSN